MNTLLTLDGLRRARLPANTPERATPVARAHTPEPGPGLGLQVRDLRHAYGSRPVLHGLNFDVAAGEFVALVGRSGCGKSTLLRLIAGLERGSSTRAITLIGGGRPDPASIRMMFQDARLLPWARVLDNVTLGLTGPEARERGLAALADVGLAERAQDWPATLSGGQRQRVALARALVHAPRLLLLDEPLGALDALTRLEMQSLIERLWQQHRFTAVLVTHDVAEAVALADRVLLLEDGQLAQDTPVHLPRPRQRDAGFAAQEQGLLAHLLRQPGISISPIHRRQDGDTSSESPASADSTP